MSDGQEVPEEFPTKKKNIEDDDPFNCDCESCVREQKMMVNAR